LNNSQEQQQQHHSARTCSNNSATLSSGIQGLSAAAFSNTQRQQQQQQQSAATTLSSNNIQPQHQQSSIHNMFFSCGKMTCNKISAFFTSLPFAHSDITIPTRQRVVPSCLVAILRLLAPPWVTTVCVSLVREGAVSQETDVRFVSAPVVVQED